MGSVSLINGHIAPDTPRMTPQEALNLLNDTEFAEKHQGKEEYTDMLLMCKEALKKQIPKKVYKNLKETYGIDMHPYHCPTCKRYISLRGYVRRDKFPVNKRYVYCNYCGQALDWSDTEE